MMEFSMKVFSNKGKKIHKQERTECVKPEYEILKKSRLK